MKLGAHISIRNGYYRAAQLAHKMGANAFQYFPKNPRSLTLKEFDQVDAENCAKYCMEKDMETVAHTPYPTNLVATGDEKEVVIRSILNDLQIAEACGSIGVVVHFGVVKSKKDPLEGYKRMIDTLNEISTLWKGSCLLLIENNAGKRGPTGTTFEELVQVRSLTDQPEKIGFCFDTCHGFASGIWDGENWSALERKGIELGYFEHLKVIHLNNSRYESGSMRDRHANINNGHMSVEQMKRFMKSELIKDLPMVLETPTTSDYTHEEEITFIKDILK